MKILLTVLASLFAMTAQAQTTFEYFAASDEWLPLPNPYTGEPGPNIINAGEFFCTGGGEPVGLFACSGGRGIHIRGTEMISFLANPDPRLEGIVWFDIAANWNSDYAGPVIGNWRIDPYAHEGYWEGTYTGKRELVSDSMLPPGLLKWVTTLRLEGYGMGDLAGMQIKATEVVTTYGDASNRLPVPWELLPEEVQMLTGTGPEGMVEITIITES